MTFNFSKFFEKLILIISCIENNWEVNTNNDYEILYNKKEAEFFHSCIEEVILSENQYNQ